MKILYITGWGRSGSTLLGNILNEVEGIFHTGELKHIWKNGLVRKRSCACNRSLEACEVWGGVFERAFGGTERVDADVMIEWHNKAPKNKAVLKDLLGLHSIQWETHQSYLKVLADLYRAISIVTECNIILDSSKAPSYGYTLSQLPGFEVHYLHLVRDARATAFSWQRKVQRQDVQGNVHMEQQTLLENAKRWMLCNAISELIGRQHSSRYVRIRYEDFVRFPAQTISTLLRFAENATEQLPFTSSHSVELGANHTVWGNPKRMAHGTVRIRQDDAWRTQMDSGAWGTTTMLTWPLLLRYGYLGRKK